MKHQTNTSKRTRSSQTETRGSLLNQLGRRLRSGALALLVLLIPGSLVAAPILVRINDLKNGPPEVEVDGAPQGYDFCTCADLGIIDPLNEDGGVITLFGVDTFGSINEPDESGWRFSDPNFPSPPDGCANAVDIVWIQHDYFGPFQSGDLQIAFNSALPGHYYRNPLLCPSGDVGLGPLTYKWQTVTSNATVVVQFKAQK